MKKLNLIFDTDVGNDCDDMMALAYLIYASKNLNVNIKAITHSSLDARGLDAVRALFSELGEPLPPIGKMRGDYKEASSYAKDVADAFGENQGVAGVSDAVSVMRRALADSQDTVICAVGPFTNIADLLESKGDEISPLDGVALVKQGCSKLVIMGGSFTEKDSQGRLMAEFNANVDAKATQKMIKLCPVPVVFSPFELGNNAITGRPVIEAFGMSTVLSASFLSYASAKNGRHSWDPMTAVYAVEGCGEFFEEISRGTVAVDSEGRTLMTESADGAHSIISVKQNNKASEQQAKDAVAEYIDRCALSVYGGRTNV